ncbi:hypothetical protein [Kribbella speibonae]|uniref:Uncharacterized protein n=1 Tax=Kribbella speibonae TaxID=1572660 RepID=A0A4R0IMP2_9ACTN|nr:hypothetical protein [Kribbella speibonae]TCC34139.1 hypothetical protein E0H92_29350 [Kribbella speibonae]
MSWVTGEVNLTRLTSLRPIVDHMLARILVAAATLLGLPATAAAAEDPAAAVPGAVVAAPVVVVGIAGLTWDNLTEDGAPTLWRMLEDGAGAAAMTVRTVHSPPCPLDGWLSLSAGRAATDPQPHRDRDCTAIPSVTDGTVDGWSGLVQAQHDSVYDPTLGLLGTTLADNNVCATAVGQGAALALATRQGQVARYYPTAQTARWDCPVTMVDAGILDRRRDPGRALRQADDTVREVLEKAPPTAAVIVLGVSQPLHSTLAMSAVLVTGPRAAGHYLTAQSTRWQGIVRLLDIPSTIVAAAGVPEPNDFTGAPLIASGTRPSAADTVSKLADVTHRDRDLRRSSGWFVNGLAAAVLLAIAALAVLRHTGRRTRTVEFSLLALAALPLCSYLVRLIQWWRWPVPLAALWLGMLLGAVALAFALRRLPRAVTVLAGITVVVLALDAITGTVLHHGSPLGPSPLSGGRYYGFGNTTFVVFAVHAVLFATGVARWLRSRSGTAVAAAAVAAIGLVTVVVDAWPTWGADVGGGFAIVPAFVLLTLDVLRRRIGVVRLLLTGAAAVVAVALISVLDWLRPAASRSHAGRFVEDLLNGDGLGVVTRKAGYAFGSLSGGPHLWLAGLLLLYLLAVVVARRQVAPAWFERAVTERHYLWGCFVAIVTIAAIGSAANDYGLRIALLTFAVAGPPLALTIARAGSRVTGEADLTHPRR